MTLNEKLSQLMAEKEDKNEFSGVVMIKRKNEEFFSGAYGYANRSFRVKNSLDTRFRIASVSKMFTAVAILQLIQQGHLTFDTKIIDYLELKETKIPKDVTIYHLLTHTSGIADYFDEMNSDDEAWERFWQERPIYHVRELHDYFQLFAYNDPVFKAGEKFQYNGAGYILLGMAIEKAAGIAYFDYIKKYVFDKAGMKDSDYLALDQVHDNTAEGYEIIEDEHGKVTGWMRNIYTATPTGAPDGGATATAEDLMAFMKALKKGDLLSKEMTEKFFKPQVEIKESHGVRGYNWMYGFANYMILNEEDIVIRGGHTGEEYGVSCRLYYYPDLNIDVVILGNQGWSAGTLGWEIHDLILGMNL